MKKINMTLFNRVLIYIIGLFSLAMGVAFSVNANLGVSPVNSLPYVISVILSVPMGNCVTVVFASYILLQIIILRKEFKWINLTQLIFSTIFGYFVDFTKWILGDFTIPTYFGSLAMVAVSLVLIALGIMLYVEANLVPMPMEGLTMALAGKLHKPFPRMKIIVDCIVVAIGIVLSLVFLHKLDGIREGTVITALLVGKLIPPIKKAIGAPIRKFCGLK